MERKGKNERLYGGFYRSDLEVAYTTSAHIPLARPNCTRGWEIQSSRNPVKMESNHFGQ